MSGWFGALARTRKQLGGMLSRLLGGGGRLKPEEREDLEGLLLQADVPARLVDAWLDDLGVEERDERMARLRRDFIDALPAREGFAWTSPEQPLCILVVGINGSGKTTTCAKLAALAGNAGKSVLLCAGDTFRAAGSSQLKIWADRIGCDVVAGATGSDAAAVAFDAMQAARARKAEVLIVDTAGRMHTKEPLMKELEKVKRSLSKQVPSAPQETWIVLDASMGQNALQQARMFHQATPLTGCVITKLDGSSKAGFVFAIEKELGVPVRFIGLGEQVEDLAPFDRADFVDALLGLEDAADDS
ncbi:MAG TPA: signal recognition particle-docking protein FtsY [Kiritimatiellia bacterium]|nr:signal recognition particle-docking protein FtsY [Kiritimatiellia bacterium]